MNKFNLNPLVKNDYFYGKLLTVRDFKTEQEYYQEKLRTLNKYIHGTGIVSGLNTVLIDDQTLSIEPGIAIDSFGRDIIVPYPITEKLSLIEGFGKIYDSKEAFLCLAYEEEGFERVQTITNTPDTFDNLSQNNRIKESYKLTITTEGPSLSDLLSRGACDKKQIVFENEESTLSLVYPIGIPRRERFEIKAVLERKHDQIQVKYDLTIDILDRSTKNTLKSVVFSGASNWEKQSYISQMIDLEDIDSSEIIFKVNDKSSLSIHDEPQKIKAVELISEVVDKDYGNWIKKAYYEKSADQISMEVNNDRIYLAKIMVLKVEDSYIMKKVITNPFGESVLGSKVIEQMLAYATKGDGLNIDIISETEILKPNEKLKVSTELDREKGKLNIKFGMPEPLVMVDNIKTGVYVFNLDENFRFGKNMTSDELTHGLGNGNVMIHLGLECDITDINGAESGEAVYYGASEVFYKSEYEAETNNYTFGAIAYPKKGTFRIGIRVNNGKKGNVIKVRWWAYKEMSGFKPPEAIKVKVDPEEIKLEPGETHQFTAFVYGDKEHEVTWSVESPETGTIDEFGMFEAGNIDGVYKIIATSKKDSGCFGESYVEIKSESKLDKLKNLKV